MYNDLLFQDDCWSSIGGEVRDSRQARVDVNAMGLHAVVLVPVPPDVIRIIDYLKQQHMPGPFEMRTERGQASHTQGADAEN